MRRAPYSVVKVGDKWAVLSAAWASFTATAARPRFRPSNVQENCSLHSKLQVSMLIRDALEKVNDLDG